MRTLIPLLLAAWLAISANPAQAQQQDPAPPAPTDATTPSAEQSTNAARPTDATHPTVAAQSTDAAQSADAASATNAAQSADAASATNAAQPTEATHPTDAGQTTDTPEPSDTTDPSDSTPAADVPSTPAGPALAVDDPAPLACAVADGRQRYVEVRGSGFDAYALQRLQGAVLDGAGQPRMNWSSVWVSPQGHLTLEIGLCPSAFRGRTALAPGTYTVLVGATADAPIAAVPIELGAPPPPVDIADTTNPDDAAPAENPAPPPAPDPAPIAPSAAV